MVKKSFNFGAALAAFVLFLLYASCLSAAVGQDHFPVCDAMRPNVAFWKKVYAEYPITKGLIHDSRDLAIIYEVIDLADENQPKCRSINQKRSDQAKEKYRRILLALSSGQGAATKEEQRVLALFGGRASAARLSQAADAVRFQQCMKDRFRAGLVRSGAYLGEIKKIFRSYDLPEDLAYLPHVESSFNYKAYSKFGAAGIWQFTQSTGKRFMSIDYTLDERRDPIRATHAAARFLKENHQRLGSWPLALTAYNHGPSGMARAKAQHGSYENIFRNYDGKSFGFASRNFYSEFIAAREVAKNYQKYFGNIGLDGPVAFTEVVMPGYAPIKDLSRHYQVDLATLRELNPALRPPVFEGRKHVPKGYKLRLPGKSGAAAQLASRLPEKTFVDKQKPSRFYQVRKGDSAGVIARKHGVKLEDLLAANGLDRRATVYAGQNLRIPTIEEKVVLLARADTTADDAGPPLKGGKAKAEPREIVTLKAAAVKKVVTPRKKEEPSAPALVLASLSALDAAVAQEEPPASPEEAVEEEDAAETEAPAMKETVMEEAQSGPEQGAAVEALPEAPAAEEEVNEAVVMGDLLVTDIRTEKKRTIGFIRVEVDETLSRYADWLKVPISSIRGLNGLPFGKNIKLGQKLKIDLAKVSKEEFEEKRYEYHKEIEEDFFAVYEIEGARLYRIKAGDNIWRLCQEEFSLPMWLVRKFNSAHDFSNLKLNEQLIIPVVGEITVQ
jgi:membrane-bound lytic murein transglycosylase D